MADQRNSSSVDDILETLKQGKSAPAGGSVEDILADLGLEQKKAAPAVHMEPETPTAPTHRTVQNFWQEPAPEPQKQRSQSRAKQKPAKAAPPPQQEEPAAPRLSDTIQMDSDFQKFFSESVAVIPDLEQEQHPGFFARFVGRKKNAEAQDDEEGLDAEDYSTELNTTEEDEPEERAPRRRRFGFWHKWNEDEEDAAEEETGEEPEESPEE